MSLSIATKSTRRRPRNLPHSLDHGHSRDLPRCTIVLFLQAGLTAFPLPLGFASQTPFPVTMIPLKPAVPAVATNALFNSLNGTDSTSAFHSLDPNMTSPPAAEISRFAHHQS